MAAASFLFHCLNGLLPHTRRHVNHKYNVSNVSLSKIFLFHAAHEVLCCILLKIMFIKCYVYLELYFVCVVFSCLT